MTKVIETFAVTREHEEPFDRVVEKLVALGWFVVEQRDEATVLQHELIPGSFRSVLRT